MIKTTSLKLLTIIADEALAHVLEQMLMDLGAKGYTVTRAEGMGRSGARNNIWEGENIKLEIITSPEVLEKVLVFISDNLFEKYPIIAYTSDVSVVRSNHFIQ